MNIVEQSISNAIVQFLTSSWRLIAADNGFFTLSRLGDRTIVNLDGKRYSINVHVKRIW